MSKDAQTSKLPTLFQASIYRRFLPYLRPYAWAMVGVVAIEFGQMGLSLCEPWMTKILFDNGFNRQPLPG